MQIANFLKRCLLTNKKLKKIKALKKIKKVRKRIKTDKNPLSKPIFNFFSPSLS